MKKEGRDGMQQVYEAVRKHVSERRGEMISLLEKIVNIDSGTTNIAGVEAVCGILKQEMEAIGMDVRVIPSEGAGPVLVGEWCCGCLLYTSQRKGRSCSLNSKGF